LSVTANSNPNFPVLQENLPTNFGYDGGDKRDQHYSAQAAAYYQSRDGISFFLIQKQTRQTDNQRDNNQRDFNET